MTIALKYAIIQLSSLKFSYWRKKEGGKMLKMFFVVTYVIAILGIIASCNGWVNWPNPRPVDRRVKLEKIQPVSVEIQKRVFAGAGVFCLTSPLVRTSPLLRKEREFVEF
ncbi:hypothetical protein A2W54_04415 [Candidatus Giovannonibacteria bacterium RIFCSPHIGHO2_02_43_13]|uniref:Uncharacterized protein n=1 Tax=Candidatus Giovannonibacteria bacterium RIFCSPHIGHO2_02_43_13 TaxID=1798330 RepID=A0A1F5WRK9_9BACT|nr:MAG: hypothetical protein A2W54_04415 [Candidatus Giovannonibacteria bacterium RIFCSPHIGHO2_02_43_13]